MVISAYYQAHKQRTDPHGRYIIWPSVNVLAETYWATGVFNISRNLKVGSQYLGALKSI